MLLRIDLNPGPACCSFPVAARVGPRPTCSCLPQALPSFQIPVSPHIYTSISWAAAPSTASSLSPVSVPVSEPVGTPWGPKAKPEAISAPPHHVPPSPKLLEGVRAISPLPLTPQLLTAPLRRRKAGVCRGEPRSSRLLPGKSPGESGVSALLSPGCLWVPGKVSVSRGEGTDRAEAGEDEGRQDRGWGLWGPCTGWTGALGACL